MTRAPRPIADGQDWVGKRVSYTPHGGKTEFGTVLRMSDSKNLGMFVVFDDDTSAPQAKFCYASSLKVVE